MHGVFQIPSITCPSNFTSQETDQYKFLASVANGGGYEWEVPEEPGHYWITSQHEQDCKNGTSMSTSTSRYSIYTSLYTSSVVDTLPVQ